MNEEYFILGAGGRKIPIDYLRLDMYDRNILHELLVCLKKVLSWPNVKFFHNETLNLFINSSVRMLIKLESTGKMESFMSNGTITVKAEVVKIGKIERSIGQHRAFKCTDERVRIDLHDKKIIENMMDCLNDIVVKKEEKKYFIPMFHHRTLNKFINGLYKIFFETNKLRHFNNCVDKEGNMYISTFYMGK